MSKRSQVDVAYDYIKTSIIEKRFFPGNRLIEEDIVRMAGVSRTSVRSAFTRLHYEGIVETVANRGTFVTRHSAKDIRDVFDARVALELGAFQEALKNVTPALIHRLRQRNRDLEKVMDNFSIREYIKYNQAFHWEIVLAANNRYYEKYLSELYGSIAVCLLFYNNSIEDTRSHALHEKIVQAFEARNLEAGIAAIKEDSFVAIDDFYIPPYEF